MFQVFLLFAILFLLVILSMVWPPDSPWSPWWRTSKTVARRMWKLAGVTKEDRVYELGSGDGDSLIVAAKEFGATCVGIEIDPLRVAQSRIAIKLAGLTEKITIFRKNFFAVPLHDATVVYAYLVPKTLKRLEKKFLDELRPGTKIISYRYPITYLPLLKEDKTNRLFVYQVPKRTKASEKK